jgi:hypothetical protein
MVVCGRLVVVSFSFFFLFLFTKRPKWWGRKKMVEKKKGFPTTFYHKKRFSGRQKNDRLTNS